LHGVEEIADIVDGEIAAFISCRGRSYDYHQSAMAMTIEPFNAFIFNTSILNQMQLHPQDVTLILGIFPINPN
jgi:hypothetical protein